MAVDLREAVQIDQRLHGKRFIRSEFALTVLFSLAIAGLTLRRFVHQPPTTAGGFLLTIAIFVFFAGLATNYAVLLWMACEPLPAKDLPGQSSLRSLMLQLSGLILLPGAIALVAWRQRRSAQFPRMLRS
jgi:hypothetical protein